MKIEALIDGRWVDLEYPSLSDAWHDLEAQGYSVTQVQVAPVPPVEHQQKERDGGLGPMRHSYLVPKDSRAYSLGYPEHKKPTDE